MTGLFANAASSLSSPPDVTVVGGRSARARARARAPAAAASARQRRRRLAASGGVSGVWRRQRRRRGGPCTSPSVPLLCSPFPFSASSVLHLIRRHRARRLICPLSPCQRPPAASINHSAPRRRFAARRYIPATLAMFSTPSARLTVHCIARHRSPRDINGVVVTGCRSAWRLVAVCLCAPLWPSAMAAGRCRRSKRWRSGHQRRSIDPPP